MTKKVLSIDLDYFMGPTIQIYNSERMDHNPFVRWKELYDHTPFKESHFYIDQGNLLYCYHTFLKALKNNPTVVFGYDHDAILYGIKDYDSIDLVNIDHHDDVFGGDYINHPDGDEFTVYDENGDDIEIEREYSPLVKEYQESVECDSVHEGNWILWLHHKKKLNSAVWICNETSGNLDRNEFNEQVLGDKYQTRLRNDYEFEDYNFDHIFVCLSPQYIPKNHWHYFTMFMMAYEEFTGNEVNLIDKLRFRYHVMYDKTTKHILNPS